MSDKSYQNIDNIPIQKFMSALGYKPVSEKDGILTYNAPYNIEELLNEQDIKTAGKPTCLVDTKNNLWRDSNYTPWQPITMLAREITWADSKERNEGFIIQTMEAHTKKKAARKEHVHPQSKLDFSRLKTKVGVTDVAIALGYHLDRKAGVGRYVEMVKGSGENKDTLVVSNPNDKAKQFFFRRNGSKGDVITLIRENLSSFNVSGNSEWNKIGKVLANFANEPIIEDKDRREIAEAKVTQVFDASRYEVKQFSREGGVPALLQGRGFTEDTFRTFAPYMMKVTDLQNEKFKGYNVGFPYTVPGEDGVQGYEMRGASGFKSKAAGTNSTSGVWIADFSNGFHQNVRNVYFFESAFDAMSFYQANSAKIDLETTAFVSVGGQLSFRQAYNVLKHYESAKMVDCFDNDLAGRMYGIHLAAVTSEKMIGVSKAPGGIGCLYNGKSFILPEDKAGLTELRKHVDVSSRFDESRPPLAFKDWNDFIRDIRLDVPEVETKFQRNEALAERRKGMSM